MTRRASPARRRIVWLGAALLAVNGVAFAAFTWPRLNAVRRAEARALEVSTRKQTLEKVWQRLSARAELLAQDRRDIERLTRDHLKPRATDLFPAQREIESLARASGLRSVKSAYAMEEIKGTGLVRCRVTLPLDGTYRSLTDFLSRVERSERFIVVDQMALSQDQAGARMNLRLSAIFTDEVPLATR